MSEELEKEKNQLEEAAGMKMPKGLCLCRLDNGELGVIETSEANIVEVAVFKEKLWFSDLYKHVLNPNIREQCSGEFIKGDD